MTFTRRDINVLLPLFLAAHTDAKEDSSGVLPSKAYKYAELPVKIDSKTQAESRQVFRGQTHDGFEIACHVTKLAPGHLSHPAHKHLNDEVLFMHEGTVEITIEGKTTRIGLCSVAYIHSNEMHETRNTGDTPAQYFVLELDGERI